jgi:hypothetical protein
VDRRATVEADDHAFAQARLQVAFIWVPRLEMLTTGTA